MRTHIYFSNYAHINARSYVYNHVNSLITWGTDPDIWSRKLNPDSAYLDPVPKTGIHNHDLSNSREISDADAIYEINYPPSHYHSILINHLLKEI